jgi:hypothetical protein
LDSDILASITIMFSGMGVAIANTQASADSRHEAPWMGITSGSSLLGHK